MSYLSLLKEFKERIKIWRKFKGRVVRVWVRKAISGIDEVFAVDVPPPKEDLTRIKEKFETLLSRHDLYVSGENFMVITGAYAAEGKVDDIIESPLGMLLKDVVVWTSLPKLKNEKKPVVYKIVTDVESMFIPLDEIIRLDFVRKKN